MACRENDFTIVNDKNNRIKNVLKDITKGIINGKQKLPIYAAYVNSGIILNYIKTNFNNYENINSLNDINDNDIKQVLRNALTKYYKENHLTVKDNIKFKDDNNDNLKFSSNEAKRIAIDYCAVHILKTYGNRFVENQETNATGVLSDLKNHIYNQFKKHHKNIVNELNIEYNRTRDNKKRETITRLLEDLQRTSNSVKQYVDSYNELLKKAKNEKNKELKQNYLKEVAELQNKLNKEKPYYTYALTEAVDLVGNNIEKNISTLFNLISTNNTQFINSIINSPKIYSLKHEISKVTENQKLENENALDVEDIELAETSEGVDETAKSWINALYSSFDKNYGAKIKIYLNTLPLLKTEAELNNPIYDNNTDNEIGLETYMDANYVLGVLNLKADTSNINNFINSIIKVSSSNPYYYGLMKLVNDMLANPIFANYVMYELNNPRFDKAISTVSLNKYEFKYSNKASNYETFYINKMINSLKSTFREFYNENDVDFVKSSLSEKTINGLRLIPIEEQIKLTENVKNKFVSIIRDFFPHISENSIEDFLNTGNYIDNLSKLQHEINQLYVKIKNLIKDDDLLNEEYFNELNAWKSEQLLIADAFTYGYNIKPKFNEKPVKNYSKLNLETIYAPCINLGKLFIDFDTVKFDLNSANAENNLSTDLLKNSYISNLFRQIVFSTEENKNTGLEELKNFVAQSEYYKNSTIFFGIRDANGNIIKNGLFTYDGVNYSVNDNAKEMIGFLLFDGVKNEITGKGVMYNNLNKNDYLITQIKAFTNPTNTKIVASNELNNLGGYFLRTPSDSQRNYIIQTFKYSLNKLFDKINQNINIETLNNFIKNNKSEIYWALYDNLLGEITNFITQLNSVFEKDSNGVWVLRKGTNNLIDKIHYNKNGELFVNGELTGNIFKFFKLFETSNVNVNELMKESFLLYGGMNQNFLFNYDVNNKPYINLNHELIGYDEVTDKITFKINNNTKLKLINILNTWIKAYENEINATYEEFKESLTDNNISKDDFVNWAMNATIANMSFDDILEGDVRQYIANDKINDARNVLKRAKEVQAGGKQYSAYDFSYGLDKGIKYLVNFDNSKIKITDENGKLFGLNGFNKAVFPEADNNDKTEYVRNGFRAVTIKNIRKVFNEQKDKIYSELFEEFSKTYSKDVADKLALDIASGYTKPTAIDDAQSFITFEEFIRRRVADGTLEEYKDLITQILEVRNGIKQLHEIDLKGIAKRIQVQKNFYFDKKYSRETGVYYNRQIKNAEFVLIPELLGNFGSELSNLYKFMIENGIDQINTEETSKAGKKNIINIWNENGTLKSNISDIINEDAIEDYYYQFLYKQQEVPQHMQDATNKAGVQIMKKIIDNAPAELQNLVKEFFDLYTANIQESADTFLENIGWSIDETGNVVNKDGSEELNFEDFHQRFIDEAMRLGMNSNFIESITPDVNGKQIIPSFMNVNSVKAESIAQAIFNSIVTRQTLPGWHAAQITSVGHKIFDSNNKPRELKYHPTVYKLKNNKNSYISLNEDEYNKLSDEEKDKYELVNESYCEVLIPRWSKLIPEGYPISKLEKEGLDIQISYRIPTEGKQSISKLKVVGFLHEAYGSTIVVPDEWVVQTGSDFDADSVYAISHKIYRSRGIIKRVKYDKTENKEEASKIRYINKIISSINQKISRNKLNNLNESDQVKKLKTKLDNLKKEIVDEPRKIAEKEVTRLINELNKTDKELTNNIKQILSKYKNKLDAYFELVDILSNNEDYKVKAKGIINLLNYILDLDLTYTNINYDVYHSYLEDLKVNPNNPIATAYIEKFNEYYKVVEQLAKLTNLYSFDDFNKLPEYQKLSRDERSSRILDIMIEIMDHKSSKEENYSRSNSEAIEKAIEIVDELTSAQKPSTSAYNPFDQLQFMEDAMGGAILKAFSVTRDTFCSVCSKSKAELNDKNAIFVKYDLSEFDSEIIEKEYKDDIVDKKDGEYIIVKHNKIGWSKNNRNVVGKLITVYSSQTTAHILDAVKNGIIKNENTYTFAAFKTLVDLGIDYKTAISFLAQPAITKILNVQKTKESIYHSQNISVFKQSLINLYNEIPNLDKKYKLDKYTTLKDLYIKLTAHTELNKAFVEIFGSDIITTINNKGTFNIILDKNELNDRLKKPINSTLDIKDIAFDLGMTLFFERLKSTGDNISSLATCITSDKFGAKQTISATRKIIENIIEYSKDDNIVGNTVIVKNNNKNKPLLQAIYPIEEKMVKDKNGNEINIEALNIERSTYPSLAAFFKYSTLLSYNINTKLFDTERTYIDEQGNLFGMPVIVKGVEKILNKKLNESQYKEFKQYIISSIFKEIPVLTEKIKLVKKGSDFIIELDNVIKNPNAEEINTNVTELFRIYGYEETEASNLKISNKNNPTKEDIEKFSKLTPAQKVFWMQENIEDESIFNKLNVNLFNDYEYKHYGYSSQTIKFDDLSSDIEELFKEFDNIWYNSNPLIKLTAIDLVKYALIAEGYKFKKGNISKIIPNHILYNSFEEGGMNITEAASELFIDKCNPKNINKFANLFVRSHSDIVNTVNLGNPVINKPTAAGLFNSLNKNRGIVAISLTSNNKLLIDKLFANENIPEYLNINRKVGKEYKTTLYKTELKYDNDTDDIVAIYLVPLNKLERSEHDNYNGFSVNKLNNGFAPYQYYKEVLKLNLPIEILIKKISKEDKNEFTEFYTKTVLNNMTFEGPKSQSKTNINLIQNNTNSENNIESKKAEKFIKDVTENIEYINSLPVEGRPSYFYVHNDSINISTALPINEVVTQEFEINGQKRTFNITRVKNKNVFFALQGSEQKTNKKRNLSIAEKIIISQLKDTPIKLPTLYRVNEVIPEDIIKNYNEEFNENKDENNIENKEMYSITSLIEENENNINIRKNSDGFLKDIYNIIVQDASVGNDTAFSFKQAVQVLNVDWNNDASRRLNSISLYKIYADYIQYKSNVILDRMDEFYLENGEYVYDENGNTLSIDNPKLFELAKNNPIIINDLMKLLLDAKTFGSNFQSIFDINFESEDDVTKYNIEKIKKSLLNVINYNKLKESYTLTFNNYLANMYSTNPQIKQGILEVTSSFKDTDWFDTQISDIGFIDNKQVQLIVKMVNRMLDKSTRVNAPKAINDFIESYDKIMAMPGSYNENNIISKDGKLILPYTERFTEDRKRHIDNLKECINKYGEDSLEYIKAKLEYDKWKVDNIEQPIIREYYEQDVKIREKVLKEIPEVYIKYKKLCAELYKNSKPVHVLTEKERNERQKLINTINYLSSELNEFGEFKTDEELKSAKILNEYINENKKLQNKYFTYEGSEEYKKSFNRYIKIIEQYEKEHANETISDKLKDSNFREAYEWIKSNTIYKVDEDSKNKIADAFAVLKKENPTNSKIKKILQDANAYDNYGNFDPRKLTNKQIKEIKELYESQYNINNDNAKVKLIKDVPKTDKVELNQTAKDELKRIFKSNPEKNKIIEEINSYLVRITDENGAISSKLLFEKLSLKEQSKLASLYNRLNEFKSNLSKADANLVKQMFINCVNQKAFDREFEYYKENIENKDVVRETIWKSIFVAKTKDGNIKIEKNKFVPNKNVYGYSEIQDVAVDKNKSEARNIIESSVEYIPTEYYFDAATETTRNGTYEEWYNANHYYNPYLDKYVPLNIWTTMRIKPSKYVKANYSYSPTFENNYRIPKSKEFKNKNFKHNSINYNENTGHYNNLSHLSNKEKEMVKLLRDKLNKYSFSRKSKSFVEKGYLPRQYKPNIDTKWIGKQVLGSLGLEFRSTAETRYEEKLNYVNDFEDNLSDPMLDFLKLKGTRDLKSIPLQSQFDTDEEYNKKVEEIIKENNAIEVENAKLESDVLDRNWKEVFKQFIKVGEENLARHQIKNPIYLLLEDLKNRKSTLTNRRTGNVIFNRSRSTYDTSIAEDKDQVNTISIVENWARRVLYKQFKKESSLKPVADLLQNITSAKYMILNVPGGFKNVGIGVINMLGESFATEYFSNQDLMYGINKYRANSVKMLADMYQDTSDNNTVAILKFFEIVNFDEILEKRNNEDAEEYSKRIRNLLYGFQSGGEHFMQNSALLAMLKSHRMYTNSDGTVELGTYNNYIWNIETEVVKEIIKDNENLKNAYQIFLKEIRKDLNKQKKYDQFKSDFNKDFIASLNDNAITKKYIELKKEKMKKSKEEFAKFPILEDLIRVENGIVTFKDTDKLTYDMLAEFGNKVKYVNKQIHGVYDKIGAAKIESEWWGSLVMQYHKHLYPGLMKRLRFNGYYNEQTQSSQIGSYSSLWRFLSIEFNKEFANKDPETNDVIKSIQNVLTASVNTFMHAKFNWDMLSEWEKRNISRTKGDIAGIISSLLLAAVIYAFASDDDEENSEFVANALYVADGLLGEAQLYTPWGLYTEAKTQWSNPIASGSSIVDILKAGDLLLEYLFDDDFEVEYETGRYAGENKFTVLLYKNTPIWRIYERMTSMTKSNKYFRLGDNAWNMKTAKSIANIFTGDEFKNEKEKESSKKKSPYAKKNKIMRERKKAMKEKK